MQRPLNSLSVSDCLVNFVSGEVAPMTVNVDSGVELGRNQIPEFEQKLPLWF